MLLTVLAGARHHNTTIFVPVCQVPVLGRCFHFLKAHSVVAVCMRVHGHALLEATALVNH